MASANGIQQRNQFCLTICQNAYSTNEQPMKNTVKLIVMTLLGGAIGFASASYGMQWLKPFINHLHGAWLILILPVSIFVSVLLHELGHIIAGSLNGFHFSLLCVFFMKVEKLNDQLKVGYNRLMASWGGLAVMIPEAGISKKTTSCLLLVARLEAS